MKINIDYLIVSAQLSFIFYISYYKMYKGLYCSGMSFAERLTRKKYSEKKIEQYIGDIEFRLFNGYENILQYQNVSFDFILKYQQAFISHYKSKAYFLSQVFKNVEVPIDFLEIIVETSFINHKVISDEISINQKMTKEFVEKNIGKLNPNLLLRNPHIDREVKEEVALLMEII